MDGLQIRNAALFGFIGIYRLNCSSLKVAGRLKDCGDDDLDVGAIFAWPIREHLNSVFVGHFHIKTAASRGVSDETIDGTAPICRADRLLQHLAVSVKAKAEVSLNILRSSASTKFHAFPSLRSPDSVQSAWVLTAKNLDPS